MNGKTPAPHRFSFFIDFDGTITHEDVGANIFLKYGEHPDVKTIEDDIRAHRITAYEGWMKLFASAPGLTMEQVTTYARTFSTDTSFKRLVEFADAGGFPLVILSDGFEEYIRLILEREELGHLKLYANSLDSSGGVLRPVFPYSDEECAACANCKRNHILDTTDDEVYTVYVGNGSSDTCPVQYCDFIFAKDDLRRYCEMKRITYFPYETFHDVVHKMQELQSKRYLRKRHQALLKRQEVYKLG